MEHSQDYYSVLGVSPTANLHEIKSAFRRLTKEYHPDKFQRYAEKNKKGEIVRRIIEAYQVLRDPVTRRQYDQEQENLKTVPNNHPVDVRSASASATSPSKNKDWVLWIGAVLSIGLAVYMTSSFLPKDPLERPFLSVGKFLLYLPPMALFAFMLVALVMFVCMIVVEGIRFGLQVGTDDVQHDSSILKKKIFTRALVVFFVLMSFAYSYFKWENPLLKIVAGIGVMILGYAFIFVPVLFGEFFALLYYVCFTKRTIASVNALVTQD